MDMDRRAFARHRTGAALLLGLSLRAPSAWAEPAEPAETRVDTMASKTAQELPSPAETAPTPALPALPRGPLVIQQGTIERVDLYLDGAPARFGRLAGGVVSAQTLGGLIETAFPRAGGSLLPALLFLLSPEVKLDHQARATCEPSARDRFSAFGFGSHDLRGETRHGLLGR